MMVMEGKKIREEKGREKEESEDGWTASGSGADEATRNLMRWHNIRSSGGSCARDGHCMPQNLVGG